MVNLPHSKGFTLVELLVTISIIAILAAIAISTYATLQKNGRDTKRKSDLAVIQSALEQYHADQNNYPVTGNVGIGLALKSPDGTKTYLAKIPADPTANPNYIYMALLTSCTNCISYSLCAKMENTNNASSLTNCASPANYEVRAP